jgi:hypothetical protein
VRLLLSNLALLVTSGTLLFSGLGHARTIRLFRQSIASHRVWPDALESLLAPAVTMVELGIGVLGGYLAFTGGRDQFIVALSVAATSLFASYALYSLYLLRRRPGAPCGCSSAGGEVSEWVVIRAGLLAAIALVLLLGINEGVGVRLLSPVRATIVIAAAVATGVIIWNLPAAMSNPWKEPAPAISAQGASGDEL